MASQSSNPRTPTHNIHDQRCQLHALGCSPGSVPVQHLYNTLVPCCMGSRVCCPAQRTRDCLHTYSWEGCTYCIAYAGTSACSDGTVAFAGNRTYGMCQALDMDTPSPPACTYAVSDSGSTSIAFRFLVSMTTPSGRRDTPTTW